MVRTLFSLFALHIKAISAYTVAFKYAILCLQRNPSWTDLFVLPIIIVLECFFFRNNLPSFQQINLTAYVIRMLIYCIR